MRTIPLLICVSALSLLAACGSNDGYYDSNGNWVPPANATTQAQRVHAPDPAMNYSDHPYRPVDGAVTRTTTVTTYYDRAGYYDSNGYYVAEDVAPVVPEGMFPPRGMCRVWFSNRTPDHQPAVESCDGIRTRVPAGAYVIYGG